jgi:hypothetical protein
MRKENSKGEEQNELPTFSLGGRYSLSSPYQKSPMQLHCCKTTAAITGTAERWEKHAAPRSAPCHNRNFRKRVCQYRLPVRLTIRSSATDHERAL